MSFAVVKFINEGTDSEDEVVSEVPVSWLVKDNKFCKWPIDNKYASIYISKNQPPQSQWKEFPVEVEYFCDSLAEAKLMMKGEEKEEKVGRGFRKLKPTYYFSPAEEDERTSSRIKKKNPGIKKGPSNGNEIMNEFMRDMNANIELVRGTVEEQALTPQEQQLFQEDTDITQVDDIIFHPALKGAAAMSAAAYECCENAESTDSSGDGKLDTVLKLLTQLEGDITSIKNFLGNLKLDMNELKQTINEKYLKSDKSEIDALQIDLPVKSLNELEQLEILVMNNKEQKSSLFEHLKRVGGNDAKDFTVRICRFLFTNKVGELCSMTGRKNNYPIGRLELVDMAFGVVHQKSKCTRKEFEEFMSEWLRHSKQRRLREENKNAII